MLLAGNPFHMQASSRATTIRKAVKQCKSSRSCSKAAFRYWVARWINGFVASGNWTPYPSPFSCVVKHIRGGSRARLYFQREREREKRERERDSRKQVGLIKPFCAWNYSRYRRTLLYRKIPFNPSLRKLIISCCCYCCLLCIRREGDCEQRIVRTGGAYNTCGLIA